MGCTAAAAAARDAADVPSDVAKNGHLLVFELRLSSSGLLTVRSCLCIIPEEFSQLITRVLHAYRWSYKLGFKIRDRPNERAFPFVLNLLFAANNCLQMTRGLTTLPSTTHTINEEYSRSDFATNSLRSILHLHLNNVLSSTRGGTQSIVFNEHMNMNDR